MPETASPPPRGTRNVLHMALGFLFVFFGFNTAQNFVVPLFGSVGSLSLGILYFVFTFVLLAAPSIMAYVGGPKRAMVLGAWGYTLYMSSMIYLNEPLVLLASVLIGASAALLWTGQGAYLLANTCRANNGRMAGVFWGVLMMSQILGNTSASLLMQATGAAKKKNVCTEPAAGGGAAAFSPGWNGTDSELFVVLAGVSALGALVLGCLPNGPTGAAVAATDAGGAGQAAAASSSSSSSSGGGNASAREKLAATCRMLAQPSMLLLAPLFFYTGIGVTFYAGQFTRQVCEQANIGYIMTCLGVAETLGSTAFGRLSDAVGSTTVLVISAVLQVGALAVVWEANAAQGGLLYLAAVLLGLADCGFQTQMYKVLGDLWAGEDSEDAFAAYKFLQSLACTCGFFYQPLFVSAPRKTSDGAQLRDEIMLCGSFLALGMIGLGVQRMHLAKHGKGQQGSEYTRVGGGEEEG